jgi:hypothetical protein
MGTRSDFRRYYWIVDVKVPRSKGPKQAYPRPPRVQVIRDRRVRHNKHRRGKRGREAAHAARA